MTQENLTAIEKYYDKFDEEHRLKTRHGLVEFNTTMHYVIKYAEKLTLNYDISDEKKVDIADKNNSDKIKILDIGAGTGRYSVALLDKGFDVTAVEPVKKNLDILRKKGTMVKTWQGNALDLNFLPEKKYDITLMLGPLYHLISDEEKLTAFEQAKRVTKDGGYIFAGYVMNDYAVIKYCFEKDKVSECLEKGSLTSNFVTVADSKELYDYVTLSKIDELKNRSNLKRDTIFASDGPADYMRRELNAMSEEKFALFQNYVLAISERPELLGASSHVVDVLQVN